MPLAGTHILVLEDEALIAMDVEQLCRDHGARAVTAVRSLGQVDGKVKSLEGFDAAIVDVMLAGEPTLPFARRLLDHGVPFVFATGYSDNEQFFTGFPDIPVIGKPYQGGDLVEALARVMQARQSSSV